MAAYGFNCVRLLIHWSKLEPQKGRYNFDYINEIKNAIEDAASYGIYVLLDMHQDAWSKYVATPTTENCDYPANGWDGAPEWATIHNNASTCTEEGSRESAPIVYQSFKKFLVKYRRYSRCIYSNMARSCKSNSALSNSIRV